MLKLVNIEYGGYKDKVTYVVYDTEKNEINMYTDTNIFALEKKGKHIEGIVFRQGYGSSLGDGIIIDNVHSYTCFDPNIKLAESGKNHNVIIDMAHTKDCMRYIEMKKPIYIGRVRNGMYFYYKHLKFTIMMTKPKEYSFCSICYRKERGVLEPNDLIELMVKEIEELIPYIPYSIKCTLKPVDSKPIYLGPILKYTNNKRIIIEIDTGTNLALTSIVTGPVNVSNVNMERLTGYNIITQHITKLDYIFIDGFSDSSTVKERISTTRVEDVEPLVLNYYLENVMIFSNITTPNFNKSILKVNKNIVYIGKVSRSKDLMTQGKALLAKYLLINKDIKNKNFLILVE